MHETPIHRRGRGRRGARCRRQRLRALSISNIRSLKAFQDANNLYKKAEYKGAIERYEASVQFNPELGFAYFFLGNSYDNLYKPAKKGEPENDANLTKAVEQLPDRPSTRWRPRRTRRRRRSASWPSNT